jgi:membrane-bound acyltransferase YfiQ involved in biofilm formation
MFRTLSANQMLAIKCTILLVLVGLAIYFSVCLYKLEVPANDINHEYSTKRAKCIYGIAIPLIMTAFLLFLFFHPGFQSI